MSQESLSQHNLTKHPQKEKKDYKKYSILFLLILIIAFASATIYSYAQSPGKYDDFAKCLTEEGVAIYGNDFCSYTSKQLNFFGKSKEHLNYVRCIKNQKLCDSKNVRVTPTWEIYGEMYEMVQTFEDLSILTGCEF